MAILLYSIIRRIAFPAIVRWIAFLAIIVVAVMLTPDWLPYHDPHLISDTLAKLGAGTANLSDKNFVFALAALLVVIAAGLAVAYGLLYVLFVHLVAADARKLIDDVTVGAKSRSERRRRFAQNFSALYEKLQGRPVVGHAFAKFCETLADTDGDEIRNTVRPQAFFNAGLAREQLPGLKLMNAIPGYFVGIGLLLTFIGLVLALGKAGQAASAANAEAMQTEMTQLLNIATFKFATSIAGLGASIVLSFVFRIYSMAIEAAFDDFCASLEGGLHYTSPQSISLEMKATLREQLAQLKDITQGEFFARMGAQIAPVMNEAIVSAMAPVSASIERAVGDLKANSQTGMTEMLAKFGDSVQGSAGTEMKALAGTLGQMEKTLAAMQNDLRGSGENFGRRMAESAEQLKTFIEEAGRRFGQTSTESRDALASVLVTLKETLERANADVETGLGSAAGKASGKLEEAMGLVMAKLDGQITGLGERLNAMQTAMQEQAHTADTQQKERHAVLDRATEGATAAQGRMQESLATAMEEVAARVNRAVEQSVGLIGERFDTLARQMLAVETALGNQRSALEGTASEARKTADAFSSTAQDIRVATVPLTQVGERFAAASDNINGSLDKSADALRIMQAEVSVLAGALQATNGQTQAFWSKFENNFKDVDTALGIAVQTLSKSTGDQSQILAGQVTAIDTALAKAIQGLDPLLSDLRDAAQSMADTLVHGRKQYAPNGHHAEAR
jgi:hypothetical protein